MCLFKRENVPVSSRHRSPRGGGERGAARSQRPHCPHRPPTRSAQSSAEGKGKGIIASRGVGPQTARRVRCLVGSLPSGAERRPSAACPVGGGLYLQHSSAPPRRTAIRRCRRRRGGRDGRRSFQKYLFGWWCRCCPPHSAAVGRLSANTAGTPRARLRRRPPWC